LIELAGMEQDCDASPLETSVCNIDQGKWIVKSESVVSSAVNNTLLDNVSNSMDARWAYVFLELLHVILSIPITIPVQDFG
jgi:hypothetical protein